MKKQKLFLLPIQKKIHSSSAKISVVMLYICIIFSPFALANLTLEMRGQTEYEQGHFELAIQHWQAALKDKNLPILQQVEIMLQLASAYQALGLSQQALTTLAQIEQFVAQLQNKSIIFDDVITLSKLFLLKSDVYLAIREDIQARYYADKSLKILPARAPDVLRAAILNNLGNVLTVEAYYADAVKTYQQGNKLAKQAGDTVLSGRILTNIAYAYFKNGQWHEASNVLSTAQQQFNSLVASYVKAFGLLSVGELAQRLPNSYNLSYQSLNTALNIALKLENSRIKSYAYGFLGHLYEMVQRYSEALSLTRQAIFYAKSDTATFFTKQAQASEILYRWQWQLGRLFRAKQQENNAINAYRNAVKSLQPLKNEMATGYRNSDQSFRERVGPVYFELADLLLKRAVKMADTESLKAASLKEALTTIEQFKTAELQDYFQDECVTSFQAKRNILDKTIAPQTGIIYPILLPDRIEILLNLPKIGIQQFRVQVTAGWLRDEVNEFRFELEENSEIYFLSYAKRLYQKLIKPLAASLIAQDINTLIIVPDGVLRTIPFAALHDGKQFLVANYAIVTTPSLTLTDVKVTQRDNPKILLNGLTKSVQGYPALLSVRSEIESIGKLYSSQNVTQLLDENFTVDNFANALKKNVYSILHIASHGQFESIPQETFLLTYDGKLTVNHLETLIRLSERRAEPVDLLTLSACQTAVGDDQAALGLAGIALKAGARSALASLWFIDDNATTLLMQKFYQQLQAKKLPKAKALQIAQQYLLTSKQYKHPAYWAPFLLIGSWE